MKPKPAQDKKPADILLKTLGNSTITKMKRRASTVKVNTASSAVKHTSSSGDLICTSFRNHDNLSETDYKGFTIKETIDEHQRLSFQVWKNKEYTEEEADTLALAKGRVRTIISGKKK